MFSWLKRIKGFLAGLVALPLEVNSTSDSSQVADSGEDTTATNWKSAYTNRTEDLKSLIARLAATEEGAEEESAKVTVHFLEFSEENGWQEVSSADLETVLAQNETPTEIAAEEPVPEDVPVVTASAVTDIAPDFDSPRCCAIRDSFCVDIVPAKNPNRVSGGQKAWETRRRNEATRLRNIAAAKRASAKKKSSRRK